MKLTAIKSEPNQSAVECAEDLLDGVKSGKFMGFVAAAIEDKNDGVTIFITKGINIFTAVGAASALHHDIVSMVKEK